MNPLTKVKLINELNEREAKLGVRDSVSWHQDYKDSAWIFMGGFPYELTEGDIICVFSQYGEVVNINLVRDKATGRSRGFCFLCYEDQRSTVLAVDNLNGIKLKGRTIRVDHVSNYRPPKDSDDIDEVTKALRERGCGARTPSPSSSEEELVESPKIEKEAKKKKQKKHKHHSKERDRPRDIDNIKQEREDPGYEKYNTKQVSSRPERDRHNNTLERETSSRSVKSEQSASNQARLTDEQRCQAQEKRHHDQEVKRGKEHDKKRRRL